MTFTGNDVGIGNTWQSPKKLPTGSISGVVTRDAVPTVGATVIAEVPIGTYSAGVLSVDGGYYEITDVPVGSGQALATYSDRGVNFVGYANCSVSKDAMTMNVDIALEQVG